MSRVLSLGYDLGDGETIVDAVTFSYNPNNQQNFQQDNLFDLRMPDTAQAGQAIPTGYGYNKNTKIVFSNSISADPTNIRNVHSYFKRKPMDLLGTVNAERYYELRALFSTEQWPNKADCPEVYSSDFIKFKESVQTFTNAIFSDATFQESVKLHLVNRDEIIICVGHPTKWSELDSLIYKTILKDSILGQDTYLGLPCSFVLAAESRAAYLYLKHHGVVQNIEQGTCSLLIDVGSSTIDVTAVTQDSRNYAYNNGNNYLGVRSIDFMIRNWYFENLNVAGLLPNVKKILQNNPAQENALILECRKAKEVAYSTVVGVGNIVYGMTAIPLAQSKINELASQVPVAEILCEITRIDPEELKKFKNKSWTTCFKEFLDEQKSELNKLNLPIGRIIVTGGASKMIFVPQIVRQVFHEVPANEQHIDADSSRTISRGLALVGPSDTKSRQFQETVETLNRTEIPQIISYDLDALADAISPIIENIVTDIILKRLRQWRDGEIITINDMSARIRDDMSEDNLKRKLANSPEYNQAVKDWTENKLGSDIALRLQEICRQYNVANFTIDDLNVMQNVKVNPATGPIQFNPLDGVVDVAADIAGVIGGSIAVFLLPTILAIILNIIAAFSTTVAGLLFSALSVLPGPGWAVIAAVVFVSAAAIAAKGINAFRDSFNNKVASYNLPLSFLTIKPREKLTDDDVKSKLKEEKMRDKVKKAIDENKAEISNEIFQAIRDQIKQKTDDIKYCIESR